MGAFVDIAGKNFNQLTALTYEPGSRSKPGKWVFLCDCGKQIRTRAVEVTLGHTKSCGHRNGRDLTGARFGRLLVISSGGRNSFGMDEWLCVCDCGNRRVILGQSLVHHKSMSCGCLNRELSADRGRLSAIDISGRRFGRLVALRATARRQGKTVIWECKCDCGAMVFRSCARLRTGDQYEQSCGCSRKERWRNLVDRQIARSKTHEAISRRRDWNVLWLSRQREKMSDTYMRSMISQGMNLRASDIPAPLIEAKRAHLKVRRELKERMK